MTSSVHKHVGFALLVLATIAFFPGIFMPIFLLKMDMLIVVSGANIELELITKELSILASVKELWQQDRMLVAALIFAFSVLVPVFKTLAVAFVYFSKNSNFANKLVNFVSIIGKWSMADVFVVAVFLTVMSTDGADNFQQSEVTFFGMSIPFEISSQTMSSVGTGFYCFLTYCLVSILATQLVCKGLQEEKTQV